MGNQHSAPEKDRDKEKEKEKERSDKERGQKKEKETIRATSSREKPRSKTDNSLHFPPTEAKVNAEETHNISTPSPKAIRDERSPILESPPKHPQITGNASHGSLPTIPLNERRTSKTIPEKNIVDEANSINLKEMPQPSEEEMKNEADREPTPKFETMRVASQTSLVDTAELNEANKSGRTLSVGGKLNLGSEKVPLVLDWNGGGKKVAVAGTFTGWRKRVNLKKS